ncbi:hypothetical protein PV10_08188 [Exophiala mesophila]|uniref:non-specific serine/threonine protein kinase n=1 Tax=Exophiala mesophila TaxID=212818 RepID=A0A0D1Z186_EXOME|nr:uncharacterized protein PV10_08188 [Exophiala mesophila]KIV88507.1 hypothetical protein PV10_08188 [Exophiala mesophila]
MHGANTFLQRLTFPRSSWGGLPITFGQRIHSPTYPSSYWPIEEATLSRFDQKRYYPVKFGDIFREQYRIIAKLGYGAYSTVWLARDEISKRYISLKVCVQDGKETSPVTNEVAMLKRLSRIAKEADHPGLDFTRLALDTFEIDGPHGRHYCIAAEAQGCSLRTLQETLDDAILPKLLVRSLVHRVLFSLNWLHAGCGVVHTGMLTAGDGGIFKYIEEQESQDPSTPIMYNGVALHRSWPAITEVSGHPIVTDFGKMRLAEPMNTDWCMPDIYRAPEVLLKLPWYFLVDIWSVGVMTLELLEGRNLFDPMDHVHNQYVLPLALSQ